MTLPIIPGPFSFLAGAGQAAGAIGGAITEKQRYEEALRMQEQLQAMKRAEFLKGIVNPEYFGTQQAAPLLAQANLPGIDPSQIYIPKDVQQSRGFGQAVGEIPTGPAGTAQRQRTFGVTTGGEAEVGEAAGDRAKLERRALGDLAKTATPEQLRALAKIVPKDVASEAEKVALMKLQTEAIEQAPARSEARAKDAVWNSVRNRLPKDETFNLIADYAAIGGLGYLTSQLQIEFGRQGINTEKIRAFANVNDKAYKAYLQAFKTWHDQLEAAMKIAHAGEYLEMTPSEQLEVDNRVRATHTAANGKEPRFDFFKKEALEAQNMSEQEWDQIGKELFKIGDQPTADPFEQVKAARRAGKITDAHIDESFRKGEISAQQKDELKAITPGSAAPPRSRAPGGIAPPKEQ